MGRIVVDVDGVTLAELINVVCDNGYSLRVVDESDRTSAERTPPSAAPYRHTLQYRAYHGKGQRSGCTRCHIRRMTSANQNGFILPVADICYVPMRGRTRFCDLNAWACQKRFVV